MFTRRKSYATQLAEVTRSRRDIVAAFEIERRRIERDLHDGAQQYLVASAMAIGEAQFLVNELRELAHVRDSAASPAPMRDSAARLAAPSPDTPAPTEPEPKPAPTEPGPKPALTGPGPKPAPTTPQSAAQLRAKITELEQVLTRAMQTNEAALTALRTTVHAIHPQVLSDMGLAKAVADLVANSPVNCKLVVPYPLPKLPEGVAATAYFLVSEALTNVLKYAPAAEVTVLLAADAELRVSVVDTGPGGAKIVHGGGLEGMRERLKSFGGKFDCFSPPGGPTTVSGSIPLLLFPGETAIESQTAPAAPHAKPQTAPRAAPADTVTPTDRPANTPAGTTAARKEAQP